MTQKPDTAAFADLFVGIDQHVPTLLGGQKRYINFDNAASTPPLKAVQDAVDQFMLYYSSVHRGTGYKSQISTHLFEKAREVVLAFVGADPETHFCVFGKNTTEAINKLARRFPMDGKRNIVLTTGMEHHSNDLPWRNAGEALHIALTANGELDEDDFDQKLEVLGDRIALVAITGASNVTGYLNPIHRIAEKSHQVGAQILVDCAQLAPHRSVDMLPLEDPAHLDFVAISAHKMYAPYGTGALIGRKDMLENGIPDMVGGGTVNIVTLDEVVWAGLPDRDEAGSPNTAGAIALAAAIHTLNQIGMDAVAAHEAELTTHALSQLNNMPHITIYGNRNPELAHTRLGVIPFNINGTSHFLAAAILGYEFGIGVRNGCFCAHPYILHLLGLSDEEMRQTQTNIMKRDKTNMPGLIRISFGLYNTIDEVDEVIKAVSNVVSGNYSGKYVQDAASGEYTPVNWQPDFDHYISLY